MSDKRRAYDRAWYHKQNTEWKLQKQKRSKKRKQKLARLVNEYKSTHKCKVCGEDDPIVLDLHHDKDKEIEISNAVRLGWGEKRLREELQKCVVLCANCHRRHHANVRNRDEEAGSSASLGRK